jgi:hypothetical protein
METRKHLNKLGAACLLLLFCGCHTLIDKPASVPFKDCYEEITDPEAHAFVQVGLELLREKYEGPRRSIETVHLRISKRNAAGRAYKLAEGFSRTELLPNGEVVIYIAVRPGAPEFYPLLGHECGHLLDPSIIDDWQMEGFCMVFSEELCARTGHSWKVWKKRFKRTSSDPYARAYCNALKLGRCAGTTVAVKEED